MGMTIRETGLWLAPLGLGIVLGALCVVLF